MKSKIKRILSEVLEVNVEDVKDNFSQKDCDKWDSLNHLNLVLALEEEFDLSLEPDEIACMISFSAIEKVISLK